MCNESYIKMFEWVLLVLGSILPSVKKMYCRAVMMYSTPNV